MALKDKTAKSFFTFLFETKENKSSKWTYRHSGNDYRVAVLFNLT